jgi:hypothetical protein
MVVKAVRRGSKAHREASGENFVNELGDSEETRDSLAVAATKLSTGR